MRGIPNSVQNYAQAASTSRLGVRNKIREMVTPRATATATATASSAPVAPKTVTSTAGSMQAGIRQQGTVPTSPSTPKPATSTPNTGASSKVAAGKDVGVQTPEDWGVPAHTAIEKPVYAGVKTPQERLLAVRWRDDPVVGSRLLDTMFAQLRSQDPADFGNGVEVMKQSLERQVWGSKHVIGSNHPHPALDQVRALLKELQSNMKEMPDASFKTMFTHDAMLGAENLVAQLPVMEHADEDLGHARWLDGLRERLKAVSPEVDKALAATLGKREISISMDIEADGKVPGISSMLSFGAAAFTPEGRLMAKIQRNLEPLPDAKPHPHTEAFWNLPMNAEALADVQKDRVAPEEGIKDLHAWAAKLEGAKTFVEYPGGFDYMFVQYYGHRFLDPETNIGARFEDPEANKQDAKRLMEFPLAFQANSTKSYASAMTGQPYNKSSVGKWPDSFKDASLPHTHMAVADAIHQGFEGRLMENLNRVKLGLLRDLP